MKTQYKFVSTELIMFKEKFVKIGEQTFYNQKYRKYIQRDLYIVANSNL